MVNSEATKVIVGAVYPAMLSEPATVRARAQTAYTIASAIAAALITAGILGDIGDFEWYVQALAIAAVGAWMLSAALYIGISRRVTKIPRQPANARLTVDQFVALSLNSATDEAEALESKLKNAATSTYVALGLTAAGLLAALLSPPSDPPSPASVVTLSAAGAAAIADQCPGAGRELPGRLDPDTLSEDFAIVVVEDVCGDGEVTVRIPPKYVLVVGSPAED